MRAVIVIPTYNEAQVIDANLRRALDAFSASLAPHDWKIVVADNGSTDGTPQIVSRLVHPRLGLWQTAKAGKGSAIRGAWMSEEADAYLFMDADLATDVQHVPELLEALEASPIVVGSRFVPGSKTERSWQREIISRGYQWMAKGALHIPVQDLQCGFKAVRREVVQNVLPQTTHGGMFFDTELLALAHAAGYRIQEIPIAWREAPDGRRKSRVRILPTAWDYLKSLWALRKRLKQAKKQPGLAIDGNERIE